MDSKCNYNDVSAYGIRSLDTLEIWYIDEHIFLRKFEVLFPVDISVWLCATYHREKFFNKQPYESIKFRFLH